MPKKIKKQKKLPIYEIVVDPNDQTTGVKMVSLLSDPAIEVQGMYFKKPRDWSKWKGIISPPCHFDSNGIANCKCDIVYNPLIGDHEWITGDEPCKFCLEQKARWDALNQKGKSKFENHYFQANKEQRIIAGPVLIPNKRIYRKDEETGVEYEVVFTPETITTIAEKFNKGNNNRSINVDHTNRMAPGFVRENWLISDSVYDKSRVFGYDLPVNTWFWMVKIEDDEFWENDVKELHKYSFSIEGLLGQKLVEFSLKKQNTTDNILQELTDEELLELAEYTLQKLKG